ncbi:lysophospholipid acyltransferase family protein, partial [Variovorax paradoxus]|uniref:lysophospholipid acyltransferase family protein n=1 Tax=Variovorax paradoxus TaxID=34073 RepID=UPI001ABC6FB1
PPRAETLIFPATPKPHAVLVMVWAAPPEDPPPIARPLGAPDYWPNPPVRRWIPTGVSTAVSVGRRAPAGSPPAPAVPVATETPVQPVAAPAAAERIEPSMEPLLPRSAPVDTAPVRTEIQGELDLPAQPVSAPEAPTAPPAPPLPPAARDADPLAPLIDALRSGDSIIIFPEGTRGHTGEPQKFKSGLYALATQFPEVVLVPAWIDNVQRVMPKGEIVPVPILCSVTFGAPIRVEAGEERRPFLDRARAAVIALRDV